MSSMMRTAALLLVCLSPAGHGLRRVVQENSKEASNVSYDSKSSPDASKALSTLLLTLKPTTAWQAGGAFHRSPVLRANDAVMVATKEKTPRLKANSWQARLDKALLDIDVREPASRVRLFQRAVGDPTFSRDLRSAVSIIRNKGMGKGHPEVIDKLWPKGTTARADLEGLTALRKQVPEFLEELQQQVQDSPNSLLPSTSDSSPPLPDPATVFNSIVSLATDPKKQEELVNEAKDALRSTPKGLETPKYKVVRTIDGPLFLGKPEPIELRQYEEFTVARTNMEFAFGSRSGAQGFNTLASYLFGKNEANQGMAMTMPVEISTSAGSEGSMSFVLPKSYADAPPAPLAGSDVTINTVPTRLVAVKPFGGIVTDKEVERQKVALLEALAADGFVTPVDESEISVLQYNSPFTIPWRRRNELAVVVTKKADAEDTQPNEGNTATEEAIADTLDVDETIVTETETPAAEDESTKALEEAVATADALDVDETTADSETAATEGIATEPKETKTDSDSKDV